MFTLAESVDVLVCSNTADATPLGKFTEAVDDAIDVTRKIWIEALVVPGEPNRGGIILCANPTSLPCARRKYVVQV